MSNLAMVDNPDAEIGPFLRRIATMSDPKALHDMCHEFLYKFPPQRGLELSSFMSWSNPFFLPDIPAENAKQLTVSLEIFAEVMMRVKLMANRSNQLNVLVACAPKSASTFIQDALQKALGLPAAGLFTATTNAYSASMLGANLMEQEADELALIRNGINGRGYVSQLHARCSPYMARLLDFYNVRPIVTYRNIFDTLVSMDDMLMGWRNNAAGNDGHYFNDGMPANFATLDRADRLMILAQRHTPWLVQFYISWRKCERAGLIKPLFVSYDEDFLGDKAVLAERVSTFLGSEKADPARIAQAFADKTDAGSKRLNKGVAGRGADLPARVREQVLSIALFYREEEDISALIGL